MIYCQLCVKTFKINNFNVKKLWYLCKKEEIIKNLTNNSCIFMRFEVKYRVWVSPT